MSSSLLFLANAVLLSRLFVLFSDKPLSTTRLGVLAAVQTMGLAACRTPEGGWWLPSCWFLLMLVNAGLYVFDRRSTTWRIAWLAAQLGLVALFCSPLVGLRHATWFLELLRHANLWPAARGVHAVDPWHTVNAAILAALLLMAESSLVVASVLRVLGFRAQDAGPARNGPGGVPIIEITEPRLHAGQVIGILERLLIYVFILCGHFATIGFVLAAKGLVRFKQLDEPRFAEYVLSGTLLSTLLAVLVGLMARALLGL